MASHHAHTSLGPVVLDLRDLTLVISTGPREGPHQPHAVLKFGSRDRGARHASLILVGDSEVDALLHDLYYLLHKYDIRQLPVWGEDDAVTPDHNAYLRVPERGVPDPGRAGRAPVGAAGSGAAGAGRPAGDLAEDASPRGDAARALADRRAAARAGLGAWGANPAAGDPPGAARMTVGGLSDLVAGVNRSRPLRVRTADGREVSVSAALCAGGPYENPLVLLPDYPTDLAPALPEPTMTVLRVLAAIPGHAASSLRRVFARVGDRLLPVKAVLCDDAPGDVCILETRR